MASSDSQRLPYWLSAICNTRERFYEAPSTATKEALLVVLEGFLAAVMDGLEAPVGLPEGVQETSRPGDWWREQLRDVVGRFVVIPCPERLQNVQEIASQYMAQAKKQNSR